MRGAHAEAAEVRRAPSGLERKDRAQQRSQYQHSVVVALVFLSSPRGPSLGFLSSFLLSHSFTPSFLSLACSCASELAFVVFCALSLHFADHWLPVSGNAVALAFSVTSEGSRCCSTPDSTPNAESSQPGTLNLDYNTPDRQ